MAAVVWSLEATIAGLRVRSLGGSGGDEPQVVHVDEDTGGVRRCDVRLWAAADGRLVLRLPGPPSPPAVVLAPGERPRPVPRLPFEPQGSATRCRFHEGGSLTFVEVAGMRPGDRTVVWCTGIDGERWEPTSGPPGFVGQDVAVGADGLWLAGHWTDEALVTRRSALLLVGFDGTVLDEVLPVEGRRGRPAQGSFFEVHAAGSTVLAVRPRLDDLADDVTDVWVGGHWLRLGTGLAGAALGAGLVELCAVDGSVHASTDGGRRWQRGAALPGGRPVLDYARRGDVVAAVTADTVVVSRDGGASFETYSASGDAEVRSVAIAAA